MKRMIPRTVIAAVAFALSISCCVTSHAGLFDWLFPGLRPQAAYYPYTVGYAPANTGCSPCNSCSTGAAAQPYTVARPVVPQVAGYGGYRPDPFYRTSWVRMPVTNYQPAGMAMNPAGVPVTAYQPCQKFAWTPRRVPATVLAPQYPAYAAAPMASQPMYAQPAYGYGCETSCASSCSPCGSCGSAIYGGSSGCSNCLQSAPAMTVPSSQEPTPAPSTGIEPADQRPSLLQNNPGAGASLQVPQSEAYYPSGLTTVPDPDAEPAQDEEAAPQLIDPRDRTAARTTARWAVVPISWPQPAAEPAPAARPAIELDDSGWTPVR